MFLTPREVARLLRVRRETVIAWIKTKALDAIDTRAPGRMLPRFKISPGALEAFERSRAVCPPAERQRQAADPDVIEYY